MHISKSVRSEIPERAFVPSNLTIASVTLAVLYAITACVVALGDSSLVGSTIGASFLVNLGAIPFVISKIAEQDRVTAALVHVLGVWLMLCLAPFSAFLNGKF